MTQARIYPKADARTQWWEPAFARGTFTSIEKVLLHTTETGGWPGYDAGAKAPTLTYHPRLRAWRQHCNLNRSARALVDPTGTLVRENRDNVIQIEIVAYADEKLARSRGHLPVSELSDAQLRDLADFIAFVRAEWGGPPLVAPRFLPYPQSGQADSPVRMSGPTYDAFKGVLGHQHASGNTHGDPGALNVARILQLAKGASTPAPTPTPAPAPAPVAPKETFLMALTDKQQTDLYNRVMGGIPAGAALGRLVAGEKPRLADSGDTNLIANLLRSIATKVGAPIDVDEAAIAKQVLAELTPSISAAVTAAVAAGTPTDKLAEAVVLRLGERLTGPA